jgi:hypothetical protein
MKKDEAENTKNLKHITSSAYIYHACFLFLKASSHPSAPVALLSEESFDNAIASAKFPLRDTK